MDAVEMNLSEADLKRLRALQKKLRQSVMLQEEHATGKELNEAQQQKVLSIVGLRDEIRLIEQGSGSAPSACGTQAPSAGEPPESALPPPSAAEAPPTSAVVDIADRGGVAAAGAMPATMASTLRYGCTAPGTNGATRRSRAESACSARGRHAGARRGDPGAVI